MGCRGSSRRRSGVLLAALAARQVVVHLQLLDRRVALDELLLGRGRGTYRPSTKRAHSQETENRRTRGDSETAHYLEDAQPTPDRQLSASPGAQLRAKLRGVVLDRRTKTRIRRTFADVSEAKSWRSDAVPAKSARDVRRGAAERSARRGRVTRRRQGWGYPQPRRGLQVRVLPPLMASGCRCLSLPGPRRRAAASGRAGRARARGRRRQGRKTGRARLNPSFHDQLDAPA